MKKFCAQSDSYLTKTLYTYIEKKAIKSIVCLCIKDIAVCLSAQFSYIMSHPQPV